jgi:hypothetical protein
MPANRASDAQLYEMIVSLVTEETGTRKRLTEQTDLLKDVGMDGDDANEFLCKFADRFQVDMSDFRFDRFFGSEGFALIQFIRSLFSSGKSPCTIALLVEAAKNGHWPVSARSQGGQEKRA